MLTCIRSKRQRNAAEYALRAIKSSCIRPYIKIIYLYGSCARGEEKYSSYFDFAENDFQYFKASYDAGIVANMMGAMAQGICENI